jgi:hypothetical protein
MVILLLLGLQSLIISEKGYWRSLRFTKIMKYQPTGRRCSKMDDSSPLYPIIGHMSVVITCMMGDKIKLLYGNKM